LVLVSLAFLPLWPDYVRALANAQTRLGILYSIGDVPLMLIPILAAVARRRVPPNPLVGRPRVPRGRRWWRPDGPMDADP
jgi:hypothetical protein